MKNARSRTSGFTLIEVTLAVGIASLGLLTLMGLFPQGLEMSTQAMDSTVRSRILQQLASEIQSSRPSKLPDQGFGPIRYFDSQGIETTESNPLSSYAASIFAPVDNAQIGLPMEGGNARALPRDAVRPYRIHITKIHGARPDFTEGSNPAGQFYRLVFNTQDD
jgi:uncharacterized protein (TIGR02598 family)